MATDYREDAVQNAFPNIKASGLTVRSQVNSEAWVVNAVDLEKLLMKEEPGWYERNGVYVVFGLYGLLYLAARFHWLPASFFKPWY